MSAKILMNRQGHLMHSVLLPVPPSFTAEEFALLMRSAGVLVTGRVYQNDEAALFCILAEDTPTVQFVDPSPAGAIPDLPRGQLAPMCSRCTVNRARGGKTQTHDLCELCATFIQQGLGR
jgi:hypothetical protein